jgi:hypothetical protein
MSDLSRELERGGGVDAPLELSARLRTLLTAELERGREELGLTRSGYGAPIVVAFAPGESGVVAVCPVPAELRADPGAVVERAGFLAAAGADALVDTAGLGAPRAAADLRLEIGDDGGFLALRHPSQAPRDEAELAALALDERLAGVDRLRCRALAVPGHVVASAGDWREPIGPTHPLRVAEAVRRLGGSPLDDESLEVHADALARLLEPTGAAARAHDDPVPVRRMARRILQRLDGSGKWGGYHTEFTHLARGFGAGNERRLALEVGERLLAAGLLGEKRSVGQRHVFLNPRRSGQIRGLIDEGELPPGLSLPSP